MFAVMCFKKWDGLELKPNVHFPFPIQFKDCEDGCTGFIPVFGTREDAEKYTGGRFKILEIQEASK